MPLSLPPPPITLPGGDSSSSTPADTTTASSTSASVQTSPAGTTTTSTTSDATTTGTDNPTSSTTPASDTSTSPTSTTTTTTSTSILSSSSSSSPPSSSSSSTTGTTTSSSSATSTSSSLTTGKSSSTTNAASLSNTGAPSTPTVITTHSTLVTTSNGVALTITSDITMTQGGTATAGVGSTLPPSNSPAVHTATPFLQNKAAVAGTFSAVGVLALIALFWAGTAFMRRRRERRFDDEADAAAVEAYKSAAGQAPYLDDDDEDFPGAGRSAYSRETAPSLAQPPLAPMPGESYGMRELAPSAGYAPAVTDGAYGAAGLGAGIGANAAVQRQRSQKSGGSVSPYNAYAGGGEWQYGGQQDPYAAAYPIPNAQPYGNAQAYGGPQQGYADGASHQDLLASAGLEQQAQAQASHRPSSAAIAAQQRGVALARSPSQAVTVHAGVDGLHRNKSITLEQGWTEGASAPVQYAPQSAEVQYAPGQNPYADVYDGGRARRTSLLDPAQYSEPAAHQEQYRAYFEPDADSVIPGINYIDDDGASVRSADHPRVLRVANE